MKFKAPKWNTYDTLYAIDCFANYWQENERLIQKAAEHEEQVNGPKWQPQSDDDFGEYFMEKDVARHLHDKIMMPMLRYSAIVMLYTTVERELQRLIENLEKERGPQKLKLKDLKGSFLQQVATYSNVFFSIQITASPKYSSITDLQKIRNCIVHAHGEVDLVSENDRKYLLKLGDGRLAGFRAWERNNIHIESESIEHFIRVVWNFFLWLFQQLNWKIDDSWKTNQWNQSIQPE